MPTNVRDPRSIVTREAFEIDEKLLGIPLARPARRLIALVIDLIVIGILTLYSEGFGVFIWGIVALFLVRMAFTRPTRLGQFTSVLFRGATGCLGILILLIVGGIVLVSRLDEDRLEQAVVEVLDVAAFNAADFADLPAALDLGAATTREEATALSQEILAVAAATPLEPLGDRGLVAVLAAFVDEDAEFTDDPEEFAREMVALFRAGGVAAQGDAEESMADFDEEQVEEISGLDLSDAIARYRRALEEGRAPDGDPEMALLQRRIAADVAADSLATLQAALDREARQRSRTEEALRDTRAELEEESGSFGALLRDIWDQAGSAVGLWSIYFTVTLTLFRGFTVGKRLMGIKVIRLDGEPMTWWSAFERGGGYVAGIATGLLGFAQIYWDPNRQCVHDKIVGTVVVVAGAEPIEGAADAAWSPDPNA